MLDEELPYIVGQLISRELVVVPSGKNKIKTTKAHAYACEKLSRRVKLEGPAGAPERSQEYLSDF